MVELNYYQVLQIDPSAEQEVVKAAYRALSRKYHPDGSHPSAERMKKLNDAYAVLKDPETRGRFNDDLFRREGRGQPTPSVVVTSPMHYHPENAGTSTRPRRPFRRNRFGIATQIGLLSMCLMALALGSVLVPRGSSGAASAPPIEQPFTDFQTSAHDLRAAFESDGYTFGSEIGLTGERMTISDSEPPVTVQIGEWNGKVSYAGLLLQSDAASLTDDDRTRQEQSIQRLLDSTYGHSAARADALTWLERQRNSTELPAEATLHGWRLRVWSDPGRHATGILMMPGAALQAVN